MAVKNTLSFAIVCWNAGQDTDEVAREALAIVETSLHTSGGAEFTPHVRDEMRDLAWILIERRRTTFAHDPRRMVDFEGTRTGPKAFRLYVSGIVPPSS